MFDSLADKLSKVFQRISGRTILTEKDISETLKSVRLALLEADVNYKAVKEFFI